MKKHITEAIACQKSRLQKECLCESPTKRAKQQTKLERSWAAAASIDKNRTLDISYAREKAKVLNSMPELVDAKAGHKFIVFKERVIVLAEINGTVFPMYCSTGLAGKKASIAKPGSWFVFWGIGPDGWFNKIGSDCWTMNNQFGSRKIQSLAKKLNDAAGDVSGFFDSENAERELKASVEIDEARRIVNRCFKKDPLSYAESHQLRPVSRYLQNMCDIFRGIGDDEALKTVYKVAMQHGVWVSEGEESSKRKHEETQTTMKENNMKKQYTRRHIQEAINYWQKQLKMMNESIPYASDENDPAVAKYTKTIRDLYDAKIVKTKSDMFICELNTIEPDKNFSRRVPWNVAVIRWLVDLVLEFNSRNFADVSMSKIDFTAPGMGVTVQFSSKSYADLAKFVHDAMCTDQYNDV